MMMVGNWRTLIVHLEYVNRVCNIVIEKLYLSNKYLLSRIHRRGSKIEFKKEIILSAELKYRLVSVPTNTTKIKQ